MNKNCPDLLLSPVDDAIANAKDHVDPHVEEGQSQARPTEERHVNKIKQFLKHSCDSTAVATQTLKRVTSISCRVRGEEGNGK